MLKIISRLFQTIQTFIFLSAFCSKILKACPFNKYDEALIPQESQLAISEIYRPFEFTQGDTIQIGFWSICIPQLKFNYIPTVDTQFSVADNEDGQLLIIIKQNEKIKIFGYLEIDVTQYTINHKFFNQNFEEIIFEYFYENYEGKWHFTLISIQKSLNNLVIEQKDQQSQTFQMQFSEEPIKIFIGGSGYINNLNLGLFKGRLSKLVYKDSIFYQQNQYSQYEQICQIPKLYQGEQIVKLVDGLVHFQGNLIIYQYFLQQGDNYFISGWIKNDFSALSSYLNFALLRISIRFDYETFILEGDELLLIMYDVHPNVKASTSITIIRDYHVMPILQQIKDTQMLDFTQFGSKTQTNDFYDALQQWYFFRYEYGKTQSVLQFYFLNSLGLQEKKTGKGTRQLTNSNYYISLGGDNIFSNQLFGYLYDFKLQFNYDNEKERYLKTCHFSCSTCDGPFETNCLSCLPNSNRLYLNEIKKCQCKKGYIEQNVQDCQSFSQYFSSIVVGENKSKQSTNCMFGYFQFTRENQSQECVKCPFFNNQNYQCLNCLLNPNNWYEKPLCTKDFVSQQIIDENSYTIQQRDIIQYDVFFINKEGLLTLYPQYSNFCDSTSTENCFLSKYQHLEKLTYVICKPNYYFKDNECIYSNPYCLQVNKVGNCLESINGMYFYDNQYFECPIQCTTCYYDDNNKKIVCLECLEKFSLINGECKQCGQNCKICQNYNDQIYQKEFLRCFKCIDDSLYFISFDAINCEENTIKYCLHAFQADKLNIQINTLDQYFRPRTDTENIVTHCAKCQQSNQIYILKQRRCLKGGIDICFFGYAEEICDVPIDDEFRNAVVFMFYYIHNNKKLQIGFDGFNEYCTTEQYCLVQDQSIDFTVQSSRQCPFLINNCQTCITGRMISDNFLQSNCLICQNGYYLDQISLQCIQCPLNLNCDQCFQSQTLIQDDWKINIRAFYKQFIEKNNQHPYLLYGQSQNIADYQITCSICISGYELQKQKCIKSCPESCLECKLINLQNICLKCQKSQQGRLLSLSDNQCIECPTNCALCRKRTEEEIKILNPLFNSQNYQTYSNQCFKSFEDKNYYYDQKFSAFIDCNEEIDCQKQFCIPINLYCSKENYQENFNRLKSQREQLQFKQTNIFIDDLVSNQCFKEFENDFFYSQANEQQIKSIIIQISSNQEQFCAIQGDVIIKQIFSQNIFTAIDIQLNLTFTKPIYFSFDSSITFENFNQIYIEGLVLNPKQNNQIKNIIFQSIFLQIIQLKQIQYYQSEIIEDYSSIILNNLSNLIVENFSEYEIFFYVNQTETQKNIYLKDFKINDSIFIDSTLFLFSVNKLDQIQFQNFDIKSKFQNSILIFSDSQINFGVINMKNILIQSSIFDTYFINLYKFGVIDLQSFQLKQSNFTNVTFILLNSDFKISDLVLENCKFHENSIFLSNSNNRPLEIHFYFFKEFKIINNKYQKDCQFIQIQKFDNKLTQLNISDLLISNNQMLSIPEDFNPLNIKASFIYLEQDYLEIQNLKIERGYGLIDISIIESKYIILQNITITQSENFRLLGIHQYLDCLLQQSQGIYYLQSIRIVSVQNIKITELNINNAQSYNSPLISFQSVDQLYDQRAETIIIDHAKIQNNLVLLTKIENPISIIYIVSKQNITISFNNINFQANILHQYAQDYLQPSALLLNLDTYNGNLRIQNSKISYNSVYNSSDSIFKINCKKVEIDNCLFDSNSLFDYEIIQPYFLWGYSINEDVYIQDLQKIFKISSLSGNGFITVEKLYITNSIIQNSKGQTGGGFKIFLQGESYIQLNQVEFYNIQNIFENQIEYGGCLCINGESSQILNINIKNIKARNIFSRLYGGFIYAIIGQQKSQIKIEQLNIQDIYSQLGSIIYISFSNIATQLQQLILKEVNIYFNFNQIPNYFDQYFGKQFSVNEFDKMTKNMTLFYIENSNQVILEDIYTENLIYQSLLQAININNIALSNVSVRNSFLADNLIYISPKRNSLQYILLNQIILEKIDIGLPLSDFSCELILDDKIVMYYKCLTKSLLQKSPRVLKNRNINKNNNYGKCFFNKIKQNFYLSQSGLVKIENLNNLTLIKLTHLLVSNINCSFCQYGLIYLNQIDSVTLNQSLVQNLKIQNSICGYSGYFIVQMISQQSNRILTFQKTNFLTNKSDIVISEYLCTNNTGYYGVCLYVDNIKIKVEKSKIKSNIAQYLGGGIYIKGQKDIIIFQTLITENSAQIGGGIYFEKQSSLQFKKLQTFIKNNIATLYGNDILSVPNRLSISFNQNRQYFNTKSIIYNNSLIIDQIVVENFLQIDGTYSNDIYLPSGQQISTYRIFDWQSNRYMQFGYKFRILALNQENEVLQNLTNSFCYINSRLFNNLLDDSLQDYQNNYTNFKIVYFNSTTNDYNLDNLIIYFNNQLPSEIYLQLEFICSSILIPIYNLEYPYNIEKYHNNYKLRLNVKSFQCQFGEIRNTIDNSCTPCDGNQDLFSLTLNSQKCEIKDDISTIQVLSAQLNLKPGYWRPYFHSKEVNYCLNLPQNCDGGWSFGYQSCFLGHIGALCEQCDLYDLRGDGQYSITKQYSCGFCSDTSRNIIIIVFISLWTFLLIFLSVQSSLKTIQEHVKKVKLKKLGFLQKQDQNYSAILMKMLTNYFQIISSITTFQLQLSVQLSTLINTVGSPIKTMVYSLDCFLVDVFNFQIQYARMVWQLIMPCFYIACFFLFYLIGVKLNQFNFTESVITTTFIYVYIYLQPSLIGGLVELLSYREISAFKWILGNVSYRYDTDEHLQWMLKFSLPILILLALIIPLFFLNRLFYNRSKFDQKQTRFLWGFLYNEYTKKAYFWEILKIFQKEIIITFLIYYDQNIIVKASIISLILLLYLELQKQYQPYNSSNLNALDYYQTIVCIISMILATGIYIAQKSNSYEIIFFYATTLAAINFYFLLILILKILDEQVKIIFRNFENQLDKIRDFLRNKYKFLNKYPYFRQLLKNRAEQKKRVQKLYFKLKNFLLPQAYQIITFKQQQNQQAFLTYSSEENLDCQSIRTFQSERQILFQRQKFQQIQRLSKNNFNQLLNERKQIFNYPAFLLEQQKLVIKFTNNQENNFKQINKGVVREYEQI